MNKFTFWKEVAAISHGKVNISGGNVFQHEIYLAIKESGKHKEVYEEYRIVLLGGERKTHKVDILIVDEDSVTAINSKGKYQATFDIVCLTGWNSKPNQLPV